LTLVARDRPGLFAAAAGSLSSFGMNILHAEAFANRHGQVLDTFTFEDPHRTLELNPPEVDRLRSIAERAIAGKTDVRDLLRNRPKPQLPSRKAGIAGRVAFDGAASQTATLVEIVAEDRPGRSTRARRSPRPARTSRWSSSTRRRTKRSTCST
jgi:UTP:GlnB (protein PII) uridylyltransferase